MKNEKHLQGDLSQHSLSGILTLLSKEQKTGILTFKKDDAGKSIYFNNGAIIFASSSSTGDRLGDILLKRGNITAKQHERSAKLSVETGKRKGMILVEEGYLSPGDLISAIRDHVSEIILSLFEWKEGSFKFRECTPPEEVITLDTSVDDLINRGTKRSEKEKASDFIKGTDDLYSKIDSITHYELLEVSMDAEFSEIKKAYLQKVKDFHPDRHNSSVHDNLKKQLSKLLSALNDAFSTLKHEKSRVEYDRSLFRFRKSNLSSSNTDRAKEHFNKGVSDFSKGNFWGAADSFRSAARLKPQESTYLAHLSLALSKIPKRTKEAEEILLKAISLEPYNSNYYVNLGFIYLNAGMKTRAVREFETALKFNSGNKKALAELNKLGKKK